MLSQLLNMGPRRLFAISLVLGGALLAVLLIVLWQLGVFDSPPPPAALQSAVESIRQEEQQEQPALTQQQQADEPAVEDSAQEQTAAQQDDADQQQSAYAQDQPHQAEQQQSADAYGYGSQQQEQEQPQQADEQSTQQQTQQQAEQQSSQESQEQQVMTPEDPSLQDLAGTWTISDRGISFVGYRIGEELANIGTATAVGRTSDIVATLEFDGVTITAVTIEADLRTLKSDEGFRDSALRTRGIESDTYPFATFVLLEPIPIDALPVGDETLNVTVNGTLDLHGVTNPVSIALQGQYVDGLVVVAGSTEIVLTDYDIEAPTGFRVLSIEEAGIMEFELVFERAP
ncbi:MAG: YceI family protein [Chloroflexota bacterium]|nr:YceI family protein [Chloroflexota bacterium]